MKKELHSKARTGKTRVWKIEVDGKFIHTTFGDLGGKMQTSTDEGQWKNRGKKNEITPEQNAMDLAERQIRSKTRKGYHPAGTVVQTSIDWAKALPDNLCFYKPDNSLSAHLAKLIASGGAWLTRKRDGEMMVFVKNNEGQVDIYSRRMLQHHHLEDSSKPWALRFAHMAEELEGRDDIPNNSIFLGDVVSDPEADSRWDVAAVMKTKTGESIKRQETTPLFFYCWDIAAWDGCEILSDMLVRDRFELLWSIFGQEWDGESWFLPIEAHEPKEVKKACSLVVSRGESLPVSNLDAASFLAKKRGWEGWVAVDPDGVYGDKGLNFRGKPDRPGRYCGKLKPVYEDDFVARFDPDNAKGCGTQGKWGRGKHRGLVGAVSLYQYNDKDELIYICDAGSGIDDAFRSLYSDPQCYPRAVRVIYNDRTYKSQGDKSDALQFPRIDAVRDDKEPEECVNPRL